MSELGTEGLAITPGPPPVARGLASPGDEQMFDPKRWLRLLVAVGVSGLIVLVFWLTRSHQLSGQIDIVGYPTFHDYNYLPLFLAYRLVTYAFPAAVIVIYLLLDWRGPLRGPKPGPRVEAVPLVSSFPAPTAAARTGVRVRVGSWLRLIPPALVVVLAVRPGTASPGDMTGLRIASAFAYVLVVTAVSWLVFAAVGRYRPRLAWSFGDCLSGVNAAGGALAAFGGLWLVSHNTVAVLPDGSIHLWRWFPWWLAAPAVIIAWAWVVHQLRQRRAPGTVEQRVLSVLVGSAAVYLIVAWLPGAIVHFQGYDDAQNLTGAALVQHGYFPWRDFQFIHGFFPDILQSLIGFQVFGATAWGSLAAYWLFLMPLAWVGVYLLGVWASRRGSLIVLGTLLLAAWGGLLLDPRFILVPVALMLFGQALASRRLAWTCALTLVLFIEGVAMPDTDFQVIAVFLVLVGAELVHRGPGQHLRATFRRTLCFIATGAILTAGWALFLASQHALRGFIDWFVVFVPGHDAEGDVPYEINAFDNISFLIMMGLAVLTFLTAAWRVRYRRPWTPVAWVTLAAALNAAVYGEQALARFDMPHAQLSLDVGLSLIVLYVAQAVPAIEDFLTAQVVRLRRPRSRLAWRPQPIAVISLVVVILLVPAIRSNIWHAPQRTREVLPPLETPNKLGYAAAGTLEAGLLPDLRSVIDAYAPKNAPFFDMTNSPGWFYFLLGLRPATVFTNVSQAIPEPAQRILIDDLRRSRPPLIAFNSETIGLLTWDEIQNQVRHFLVSQYVLDHWTPLISTRGVLFLLRNDLLASRPLLPHLIQPPITTNLYASLGPCDWGDAANFLSSPAVGPSLTLPAQGGQGAGISTFKLPPSASLSSYQLVTFHAAGPIGNSTLTLSDVNDVLLSPPTGAEIIAGALPVTGSRLAVRVGSCLPWHDYHGHTLYLAQTGGAPITSLTLSDVQQ